MVNKHTKNSFILIHLSLPEICKAKCLCHWIYASETRIVRQQPKLELANKPLRLFELRKLYTVCVFAFFSLHQSISLKTACYIFYLIRHPFDIHTFSLLCVLLNIIGTRLILRFVQLNGNREKIFFSVFIKNYLRKKRQKFLHYFCHFLVGN